MLKFFWIYCKTQPAHKLCQESWTIIVSLTMEVESTRKSNHRNENETDSVPESAPHSLEETGWKWNITAANVADSSISLSPAEFWSCAHQGLPAQNVPLVLNPRRRPARGETSWVGSTHYSENRMGDATCGHPRTDQLVSMGLVPLDQGGVLPIRGQNGAEILTEVEWPRRRQSRTDLAEMREAPWRPWGIVGWETIRNFRSRERGNVISSVASGRQIIWGSSSCI